MRVKNVSARLQTFHVDIKPGETVDVPKEYQDALRKAPCFTGGEGFPPELVEAEKAPQMPSAQKGIKGLRDMTESAAVVMVSKEKDLEILKAWGDAETREPVLQAIAARFISLGGK